MLWGGCLFNIFFLIPALLMVVVIGSSSNSNSSSRFSNGNYSVAVKVHNVSEDVKRLQPIIEQMAEKHGILEYVPYLMAIMQIESGGKGGDPMQSSESLGLAPNAIQDPTFSIDAGAKHFANTLRLSREKGTDLLSAIGAYNFGTNYINFISKNGGQHSLELAEKYSYTVVAPALGNSTGETYRYVTAVSTRNQKEYLYVNGGNFYYVDRVLEHIIKTENNYIVGDGEFIFPLATDKYIVTSPYGVWRKIHYQGQIYDSYHNGIDLVYADGRVHGDILATASGTVKFVGFDTGGNGTVIIQHHENLYSYYLHLSSFSVQTGDNVNKGQVIGKMGNTGFSEGEHLHFAFSKGYYDDWLDPNQFVPME